MRTSGPELFYHGAEAARTLGIDVETVDHVVPHQANGRMAELLGPFLGIEQSSTYSSTPTSGQHGFGRHLAGSRRAAVASRTTVRVSSRWERKQLSICSAAFSMFTAESVSDNVAASAPVGETLVAVRDVTKRYGHRMAVESLNLALRAGEVFGLVGANGGGKTTTLRILAGILKPDAGQRTRARPGPREEASEIRKHVGYMSQRLSLYADLSVFENLRFRAEVYGSNRPRRRLRLRSRL